MRLQFFFALALSLSLSSGCGPSTPSHAPRAPDAISVENQQPGDPSWELENPGDNHELEGYGKKITLHPGDSIDVAVHVDHPKPVSWVLYRFGYYGGAGARRLDAGGPIAATPQPSCPRDPTTSRIECAWPGAFTVTLPKSALGGVYLIKLNSDDGYDWHVPFVVYDGRLADIVADVDVTTWQAYNDYGGESLYEDDAGFMPSGKAWEVSYDRPFREGHGAGRFLQWEFHMVRWMEALGYDVSYTTAFDIGRDPTLLAQARVFLSVANDEYWTPDERDAVERARDGGVNLAFLGADQALWRIRLEPSQSGVPERVIACYKSNQDQDPEGQDTARFRDDPNAEPENGLIGVMYNTWMLVPQPLVVRDATSWIWDGTGLTAGDTLPMMVSFETDGLYSNGAQPPGLQVVAESPFLDAEGGPLTAVMSYYVHPSGAEVVGAGTMGWPTGLGAPLFSDPRVAKATRNILDRFVGAAGKKGAPDPENAPWLTPGQVPKIVPAWARAVTTPATGLLGPDGIAVAPDGTVYIADSPSNQIKIAKGGVVSVLAGDGVDGDQDGPGASARFRMPAGLLLDPDGTLYVADADNHVIRAIAPDAAHTVSTWAGLATRGGGFAQGPGATAQFNRPVAIARAPDGALMVADMHNCQVRRVDPGADHAVSTWAGSQLGYQDGPGTQALFNNLSGVAVDASGVVYVLDTYNQALRRIDTDPAHTVSTLVGGASQVALVDGVGTAAMIGGQGGLALAGGRLYFSDVASERVRVIVPGVDAASTRVMTFAGSGREALTDGAGAAAAFAAPTALAGAADGSVWLADSGNGAIRKLVP